MFKRVPMVCSVSLGFLVLAGCGVSPDRAVSSAPSSRVAIQQMQQAQMNVLEVAKAAGNFKTLLAAIDAAGLRDTLASAKEITVLAPTDEAFAKLPAGTVAMLLKPENKEMLVKVLTYHVLPGLLKAEDVSKLTSANSVSGSKLNISSVGGRVRINDANVIKADIPASNGVIHVIDTVLVP
ncbi:Immunogenic protein MPT70 precursor [compost metagenome]